MRQRYYPTIFQRVLEVDVAERLGEEVVVAAERPVLVVLVRAGVSTVVRVVEVERTCPVVFTFEVVLVVLPTCGAEGEVAAVREVVVVVFVVVVARDGEVDAEAEVRVVVVVVSR